MNATYLYISEFSPTDWSCLVLIVSVTTRKWQMQLQMCHFFPQQCKNYLWAPQSWNMGMTLKIHKQAHPGDKIISPFRMHFIISDLNKWNKGIILFVKLGFRPHVRNEFMCRCLQLLRVNCTNANTAISLLVRGRSQGPNFFLNLKLYIFFFQISLQINEL